jgi:hypothetical protein
MKIKIKLFLVFILTALMVQPAFAYIDPGSGSTIMSVIIGFFVTIGVLIKTFWYKIKSFFGFKKFKKTNNEIK